MPHGRTISQARSSQSVRRHAGVEHNAQLEQEARVAMGEGGRAGRHAVVGAAPRREVELAHLALPPAGLEMPQERGDRLGGQRVADVVRPAVRVPLVGLAGAGEMALRVAVRAVVQVGAGGIRPSRPSSASVSAAPASIAPKTLTTGGSPGSGPAVITRLAAISSGALGRPRLPRLHELDRGALPAKVEGGRVRRGTVRNVNDVTIPKCPPPAPRSAQKRSGSWCSSHATTRPSASATSAPTS